MCWISDWLRGYLLSRVLFLPWISDWYLNFDMIRFVVLHLTSLQLPHMPLYQLHPFLVAPAVLVLVSEYAFPRIYDGQAYDSVLVGKVLSS